MCSANKIVLIIVFVAVYRRSVADPPNFRVLAPEFVCPNNQEVTIDKPDNTVITVKTDAPDLQLSWTVRWTLLENPSQRFTLLLWKTTRALEAKLNAPQPEPFVYVIDNAELLQGVEYIFNVTASDFDSENSSTKTFAIDNIKGDPTLLIEGRSEKLSVLLLGSETVYAYMVYVIEAQVTICTPTQDYYFAWSVRGLSSQRSPDIAESGSRLEIPPHSLQLGQHYVSCAVYRNSGEFVTQTSLPLQVLSIGLTVHLNFDTLIVTKNNKFDVLALVENHDHYGEDVKYAWSCVFKSGLCENFESTKSETILSFSHGFLQLGRYEIFLTVTVQDQVASTNATIVVIEPSLPVLEIEPLRRIVNEHTMITLVANASNVAPSCSLTWYFATEEHLANLNQTCEDCQHGKELPGSVTITSLEEVFLNELADFTNETEWRQVEALTEANAGRARFVARCGCSLTFSCETQGVVYAEVNFELNKSPIVSEIMISPATGTAMETVFRLSTLAASDPEKPLLYTFYCSLGYDKKLMLASNLEHLATDVLLPYVDQTGTKVWVEVCDSLGACSTSEIKTIQLLEGMGKTVQALVASTRGHVARCEMMMLRRLVQSTVVSYINTNQQDVLKTYIKALSDIINESSSKHCSKDNPDFMELLDWLAEAGINI